MWSSSHYSRWRLVHRGRGVWRAVLLSLKQTPMSGWLSSPLTLRMGLTSSLDQQLPHGWEISVSPRKCSQPRTKSWPENPIIFCEKLLVRRRVPRWNIYSTQSQTSEFHWHQLWWVEPLKRSLQVLPDRLFLVGFAICHRNRGRGAVKTWDAH